MNTKTAVTPPVANQASNGNAKRLLMMALPVIVAVLLLFVPVPEGLPPYAWHYFAIFVGVIVGLPRTGTTHLHNLLAAAGTFRTLPYWESMEPFPLASEAGIEVLSGLDLLVHQAVGQVRLFTGRDVAAPPLMDACLAELRARASGVGH